MFDFRIPLEYEKLVSKLTALSAAFEVRERIFGSFFIGEDEARKVSLSNSGER